MSWLLQKVGYFSASQREDHQLHSSATDAALSEPALPSSCTPELLSDVPSPLEASLPPSTDLNCILETPEKSVDSSSDLSIWDQGFTSFENGLLPFVTKIATTNGFTLSRTTHRMDIIRSLELFNDDNVIQRGHFYCSSGASTEYSCRFRIPFTFNFQKREYLIKKQGLQLEHNHQTAPSVIEGVLFRKTESELTTAEKVSILELAPFVTIGALRRILRNLWPSMGFESGLLYRLKAKGKLRAFGNDKDAINTFMESGQEILANSGVFDVRFDECMKIEEVLVQTSSMAGYAKSYGDFTILDGTFCISMYDLVLMVFSNVDALLKTTITGFVLAPSERSDSVVRASQRFSLAQENTVLMTDQASAFASAAISLKKVHLLCLHHFRTAMFSAHGGMSQEMRNQFLKSGNELIFKVYETPAEFCSRFDQVQADFARLPAAKKFLQSLWEHRQSTCATFTSAHFTAGHVSSQRAESNNSRIKEGGQLKKELSTYNLKRLLDHILAIVREQTQKTRSEIKDCIKSGAQWSKGVDKIWKSESHLANDFNCVCVDEEERIWEAVRHDGQGWVHVVKLPSCSGQNFASCNCRDFSSRLIPCRGICAVYARVQDPLFSISTLHHRWWISNHPEFNQCMVELGLPSRSKSGRDDSLKNPAVTGPDFHLQLFQQIQVPNTQQARFRRLDEKAKEAVSIGSSVNDFTYRFVMNGLSSVINAAKSLRDGTPVESFGISAPALSHQNPKENLSRCRRQPAAKRRKVITCSVCAKAGRTDGVGHRAFSTKCPMFKIRDDSDSNQNDQDLN